MTKIKAFIAAVLAIFTVVESAAALGNPVDANYSYSPGQPTVGEVVHFDGSASTGLDGPLTYKWNFYHSNGTIAQTKTGNPLDFTFAAVGTKDVELVVTDADGDTDRDRKNIVVTEKVDHPAVASYTISPSAPKVGETVTFNAAGSTGDDPLTYTWNFLNSNGTVAQTKTGNPMTFAFSSSADKTVELVVTDADGDTNAVKKTFFVAPAATDPPSGWDPGPLLRDLNPSATAMVPPWDDQFVEPYGSLAIVTDPMNSTRPVVRSRQVAMNEAHKRAELQNHRRASGAALANGPNGGEERFYEFGIYPVSSGTIINGPPEYNISQFRVTNIFCFTGGFTLKPAEKKVLFHIRAGNQSGCTFPVDKQIVVGDVVYGKWASVRLHAKWSNTSSGFLRIWYNDQLVQQYNGPTIGRVPYPATDVMMWRVGVYAGYHTGTHEILYGGMKMYGP